MLVSYLKHTVLSYLHNLIAFENLMLLFWIWRISAYVFGAQVSFLFTWYLWRRRDEIASILFLNYEYSENSSVCMFVQPADFQNTPFRTHVFRKTRSLGTQLFLHLMRYLPASIKTKSAYISSGLRPVKLVVTGFRLCPDAKREFCSSLYVPYLNSFSA